MPPSPPPQPPDHTPPPSLINNVQNAVAEIENRLSHASTPVPRTAAAAPPPISTRVQQFERCGPLAMASFSTPPPPPPPNQTPLSPTTPSSSVASFVQHFENSSPTSSQTLTSLPHSSKPIAPTVQHFESQTQCIASQSVDSQHPPTSATPAFHHAEMPSESPVLPQNLSESPPVVPPNAAMSTDNNVQNATASVTTLPAKSEGAEQGVDTPQQTDTPAASEHEIPVQESSAEENKGEELVSGNPPDAIINECNDVPQDVDSSAGSLRGNIHKEFQVVPTGIQALEMFHNPSVSHDGKADSDVSEEMTGMVAPVVEMFENLPSAAEEKSEVPIAGAVAPVVEMFENPLVAEDEENLNLSQTAENLVVPVVTKSEDMPSVKRESEISVAAAVAPIVDMFENSSVTGDNGDRVQQFENEERDVAPKLEMFQNPMTTKEERCETEIPGAVAPVVESLQGAGDEKSEMTFVEAVAPVVDMFENSSKEAKTEILAPLSAKEAPIAEIVGKLPSDAEEKRQAAISRIVAPVVDMFETPSVSEESKQLDSEPFVELAGTVAPVVEMFENAVSEEAGKIGTVVCSTVHPGVVMLENPPVTDADEREVQATQTEEGAKAPAVESQLCEGKRTAVPGDETVATAESTLEEHSVTNNEIEAFESSQLKGRSVAQAVGIFEDPQGAESEQSEPVVSGAMPRDVDILGSAPTAKDHSEIEMPGELSPVLDAFEPLQTDDGAEGDLATSHAVSTQEDTTRNPTANEEATDRADVQSVSASEEELLEKLNVKENPAEIAAPGTNAHSGETVEDTSKPRMVEEAVTAVAEQLTQASEAEKSPAFDIKEDAEDAATIPQPRGGAPENPPTPEEFEGSNPKPETTSNVVNGSDKPHIPGLLGYVTEPDSIAPVVDAIDVGTVGDELPAFETDAPLTAGKTQVQEERLAEASSLSGSGEAAMEHANVNSNTADYDKPQEVRDLANSVIQTKLGHASTVENAADEQSTGIPTGRNIASRAEILETEEADYMERSVSVSAEELHVFVRGHKSERVLSRDEAEGDAFHSVVEDENNTSSNHFQEDVKETGNINVACIADEPSKDDVQGDACKKSVVDPGDEEVDTGTQDSNDVLPPAQKAEQVEISLSNYEDHHFGDHLEADFKKVCIARNTIGAEISEESGISRGAMNGGGKNLLATYSPNHNFSASDERDNKVVDTPTNAASATVESPGQKAVSSASLQRHPSPEPTPPDSGTVLPATARTTKPQGSEQEEAGGKLLGVASTRVVGPLTETAAKESKEMGEASDNQATVAGEVVMADHTTTSEGVSTGFEDLLAEAESLAVAGLSEDLKEFQTEITDLDDGIPIVSGLTIEASIPESGISSEEARLLQALNAEIARMELSAVGAGEIHSLSATEEEMFSTVEAPEDSAPMEGVVSAEKNEETKNTETRTSGVTSAGLEKAVKQYTESAGDDLGGSFASGTSIGYEHRSGVSAPSVESDVIDEATGPTVPAGKQYVGGSPPNGLDNNEDATKDSIHGEPVRLSADSNQELSSNETAKVVAMPTAHSAAQNREELQKDEASVGAHEESAAETDFKRSDGSTAGRKAGQRFGTPGPQAVERTVRGAGSAENDSGSVPVRNKSRDESNEAGINRNDCDSSPADAHVREREGMNNYEKPHEVTSGNSSVEERPTSENQGEADKVPSVSEEGALGNGSPINVEIEHPQETQISKMRDGADASPNKETCDRPKEQARGRLSRHLGRQSKALTSSPAVTPGRTTRPFSSPNFIRRNMPGAENRAISTSVRGMRNAADARAASQERNMSSSGSRSLLRNSLPNVRGQRQMGTPLRDRVGGVDGMSPRLPRVAGLSGGRGDKVSRPRLQRGSTFNGTLPKSTGAANGSRGGGKAAERGGPVGARAVDGFTLSPTSSTASTPATPAKELPNRQVLRRTMSFSHTQRATSSGSSSVGARSPSPRPPFGSSSRRTGIERRSESPAPANLKRFDRRATTSVTGSAGKPPRSGGGGFRATVPRPFDLVGLEMHEKMQREIEERRKRMHENEQKRRAFKARPMPDFSRPSPRPKRNSGNV